MPGPLQPSLGQRQNRLRNRSGWKTAQNQGLVGNDYTVGQMAKPQPSELRPAQNEGINGNDYAAPQIAQLKSSGRSWFSK